ncbi:MAG TPA: TolC family protein [Planktothrix sp.]|jgi:outer membrane protein TolC
MKTGKRMKLCAAGAVALCLMSPTVTLADDTAPAETLKGPITPVVAPAGTTSQDAPAAVQSQPAANAPKPPAAQRPQESAADDPAFSAGKNNQANATSVSSAPIIPIHIEAYDDITVPQLTTKPNSEVVLPSMPLKGLIQIDRRLSPFGLDAGSSEEVGMRDVLLTTVKRNLDISDINALSQSQKFLYYQALSKYLPDIVMGYSLIGVDGNIVTPGGFFGPNTSTLHIKGPFTIVNAGFVQPIYKGGAITFGAIENKHKLNASRKQLDGQINDSLNQSAQDYYNLLLNEALLQIRIKAVERSEEQLKQNTQLQASGLATNLDVLQARTQLARDRQSLLDQQSARRVAAIQLAHVLNISLSQDLIPASGIIRKERLIDRNVLINSLLTYAVDNRPELKQYDELRKAAKAQIIVAGAPLHPQVLLNGSVYGIGTHLDNLGGLFVLNFNVKWTLGNLGLSETANINSARWQARDAMILAQKEFLNVFDQVRTSYANTLTAEQKIEQTNEEEASAREELRLARLRLDTGLGTNLDVLTAQRDLTQAQIDQAQSVINFNQTQVQLVHDIGRINVDSLTSGRLISKADGPQLQ